MVNVSPSSEADENRESPLFTPKSISDEFRRYGTILMFAPRFTCGRDQIGSP